MDRQRLPKPQLGLDVVAGVVVNPRQIVEQRAHRVVVGPGRVADEIEGSPTQSDGVGMTTLERVVMGDPPQRPRHVPGPRGRHAVVETLQQLSRS